MTKEEFFNLVRKNAKHRALPVCKGLRCGGCPFAPVGCNREALYFLLEAYDELKKKYDEVIS